MQIHGSVVDITSLGFAVCTPILLHCTLLVDILKELFFYYMEFLSQAETIESKKERGGQYSQLSKMTHFFNYFQMKHFNIMVSVQ